MAPIARFLHISDVHLGAFPDDAVRRHDVALAFERAIALGLEQGVQFVVIAGDLFDRKTVSPDVLRDHARRPLERLREAGIPVYVIEGNHDEAAWGSRHSWVTYLGTDGLVIPLRPVLEGESIAFPANMTDERPAGRAVTPGGIPIYGLGYLGPRTDEVLRALTAAIPDLGREGPAIVLLHAMRSPVGLPEAGLFTDEALEALAADGRQIYLALGHGHRRFLSPGRAVLGPAPFVAASPGSLEYIHETDFHLEDPRGAIVVDVLADGRFRAIPHDTLKRPRCLVTVALEELVEPAALPGLAVERCRAAEVPGKAILALRLEGEPAFARSQLPLGALERRVRDAFAPVSLDVAFSVDLEPVAGEPGVEGAGADRPADVVASLALALRARAAGADPEALDRLAAFVAPRVGDGSPWREAREDDAALLEDALGHLLDLVAGPAAASVRDVVRTVEAERGPGAAVAAPGGG